MWWMWKIIELDENFKSHMQKRTLIDKVSPEVVSLHGG